MNQFTQEYIQNTYDIAKTLSESDKSKVLLASNKNDGKFYVIKYINRTGLPYKELQKLNHKLLPHIVYVSEDDNQTVTVEEYINAHNLQELLQEKGSFDEATVKDIALQLCNGLQVLHEHNIIHRDIKPSNILLNRDGTIKLIDFDAARVAKSDVTNDTKRLGTEGYAPPEQYGFAQTDNRSDIYALGITLKALVGDGYEGWLSPIIAKAIELNPNDRYQTIFLMTEAIKNIHTQSRRKPIIAAILIVLLAIGVYSISGDTPDKEAARIEKTKQINAAFRPGILNEAKKIDFGWHDLHRKPKRVSFTADILGTGIPQVFEAYGIGERNDELRLKITQNEQLLLEMNLDLHEFNSAFYIVYLRDDHIPDLVYFSTAGTQNFLSDFVIIGKNEENQMAVLFAEKDLPSEFTYDIENTIAVSDKKILLNNSEMMITLQASKNGAIHVTDELKKNVSIQYVDEKLLAEAQNLIYGKWAIPQTGLDETGFVLDASSCVILTEKDRLFVKGIPTGAGLDIRIDDTDAMFWVKMDTGKVYRAYITFDKRKKEYYLILDIMRNNGTVLDPDSPKYIKIL